MIVRQYSGMEARTHDRFTITGGILHWLRHSERCGWLFMLCTLNDEGKDGSCYSNSNNKVYTMAKFEEPTVPYFCLTPCPPASYLRLLLLLLLKSRSLVNFRCIPISSCPAFVALRVCPY